MAFFLIILTLGIGMSLIVQTTLRQNLINAGIKIAVVNTVVNNFTVTAFGLLIGVILISLWVCFGLSNYIVRPIKRLHHATEEMEKGNLNIRVDIKTGDEIQQLAETFNSMTSSLKESYTSLEQRVKRATDGLTIANEQLQKKTEDLERRSKELEDVNKELDSFTYTASHDLKEPLRGISTFSQFLLEDYADKIDDAGKDYLKRITAGVARMQNLIDDLLALSRISRTKLPFESVDSGKLIKEVVKRLKPIIEEKKVRLEVDDELPFIYCEPVKMKEVFYNLISNAIKYNDNPEPLIEIGITGERSQRIENHDKIVFFIKDNGIGIKREHFEDVFQIFRRLHDKSAYGGGTGAGLAIVKKIIEEHAGKVWIESEEGKGSTFLFLTYRKRWQKSRIITNKNQKGGTEMSDREIKPIDVLLVDDSEDDILIIQRAFKKVRLMNGMNIVRSGQEALDYIYHQGKYSQTKTVTPGLMLLDIQMPDINGFQVLEKLKSDPKYKSLPVVMLTTSSREEDVIKSYENGAVSFITKPANFNDFVKAIEGFEIYWTLVSKIP